MRYTFLLYSEPSSTPPDPETMQRSMQAFGAYIGALKEAGIFVDTDWLQPGHTATTLTVNDGVRKVQDGPYADTKEQLGGYFVVEVDDLDTALDWAEKCPIVNFGGKIEIRPSAMPEGQKDNHD